MPNANERIRGPPQIRLIDCGLEDLVAALLAGQSIAMPDADAPFILPNDDARRIFSYYAQRRYLWLQSKPIQVSEIEEVLKALEQDPPIKTAIRTISAVPKHFWRLERVEAHRFGGLHRHCAADGGAPDDFAFEVESDVTLISGYNGAGKTALQNTIIWCLTGKALRSQHLPDDIHEPMQIHLADRDDENVKGPGPELAVPPIVPIPSGADLAVLHDRPKIDTWAQLTFRRRGSNDVCVVRRGLAVSGRGKVSMTLSGLENLGVPDLSIEVGTLMVGVAANMRFDEKTTFGHAIALLTGLKPLEDLGRRSARMVKRLRTDESKKTVREASSQLENFERMKQGIRDAWSAQTDLGEPAVLIAPHVETDKDQSKKSIADARRLLVRKKETLERTAKTILGEPLQVAADHEVAHLDSQLVEALDSLKSAALNELPSVGIIKKLGAISDDDCVNAERLIAEMARRARAMSEMLRKKQEAARWQLYTRVAKWHAEHHQQAEFENCPVCGTDLNEVPPDALLNKKVKEALRLCSGASADAAKSAEEWERDAAREFLEQLPESLREFTNQAIRSDLLQIFQKAFVEEIFANKAFSGHLKSLKRNAKAVWQLALHENPLKEPVQSESVSWPTQFTHGTLRKRTANVQRAIVLVKHRLASVDALKEIVQRYIGASVQAESKTDGNNGAARANEFPVRDQIKALQMCLTNTAPLVSLLRQIDELETQRKKYATLDQRRVRLERAANAMEEFAGFENLVFQQVSGLIGALDLGTRSWLRRIYRPHYHGGPSYVGFDALEQKGIGLRAGIGEMQVPAHKIMNASLLRACVWAFLFSLWERVRSRFGGLDCMLLDDPQNYFDPINAENFAMTIPQMPEHGMRPIVTSNDNRFLAAVTDNLPRNSTSKPSWRALLMNPVSSSRLTAGLSPAVEAIYERQKDWQADENSAGKAQDFVSTVRLYVENRLWNLLATDPIVMHKPTLAELIQALRTARNNGEKPFDEVPFRSMLSHAALRDNAPFYRTINKAHHRLQDVTPYDAGQVEKVFREIDRLLRSCSACYARFMGRLTREDKDLIFTDFPPAPKPATFTGRAIPLFGEVSARSSVNVLAVEKIGQYFNLDELGEIALYGVRSPSLGSLALQGQVVVVSIQEEAQDGDPVVALSGEKIYLRRLFGDKSDPSRVVLASDTTGTERVPPTLILPKARTRLLPIVGVLYEQLRFSGKEEAESIDASPLLGRDLVAANVTDDSAYPIIRSGDVVLMEGIKSLGADVIGELEDRIVVAVTEDGSESFAYLKRLGGHFGPGLRFLENVGLKGNALAVATSADAISSSIPPLYGLWRVHGTLRRPH